MSRTARPQRILLVTGMSGAGKTTVLKTLEDLGWETVDHLPLPLLGRLLDTPTADAVTGEPRPLAIGIGSRTRGFDAQAIARRIGEDPLVSSLFLDCGDNELARRYSETRRRHPLAADRPALDGIAAERGLLHPLRRAADQVIDTTDYNVRVLQDAIRRQYGVGAAGPTLTVMSFGFAQGIPRNADNVIDMRFLHNPHWVDELRRLTGLDGPVKEYVAADPAYGPAVDALERLLLTLLPGYEREGKSYVTGAIGCTGGRHRSVHVAETIAARLRAAGFSPTVEHRDLGTSPQDAVEAFPARAA